MNPEFDFIFTLKPMTHSHRLKLALIGDSGVGKTAMLRKFMDGTFDPNTLITVGIDYQIKPIVVDDTTYQMEIWDTAGQERFRSCTISWCRKSHGIVYVFNVTDRVSFNNIRSWMWMISRIPGLEKSVKILVGNKIDLESATEVSYKEAKKFADEFSMTYVETSANSGHNVIKVFTDVTQQIVDQLEEETAHPTVDVTKTYNVVGEDDTPCCVLL